MQDDTRRSDLVDKLADHVLAEGLAAASLRQMAKAAGTSDRMLLYYFKDKDELLEATLERIAERLTAMMQAGAAEPLPPAALKEKLTGLLFSDAVWPFMRVWLELAAGAARGNALYKRIGEAIGRGFFDWGVSQLDSPPERIEADAAALLVSIEGMALLRAIGLDDVCEKAP